MNNDQHHEIENEDLNGDIDDLNANNNLLNANRQPKVDETRQMKDNLLTTYAESLVTPFNSRLQKIHLRK